MEIKDSGARREFASGAVRDCSDDKGRCDLIPLDIVSYLMNDQILEWINEYIRTGKKYLLAGALAYFCEEHYGDIWTAMLEVAKHYADGCAKYSERNWEKGMYLHCYVDSGVRHYLKFKRGDKDEPHDRAFIWNMLGALWTQEHLPEYIDLPFKDPNHA